MRNSNKTMQGQRKQETHLAIVAIEESLDSALEALRAQQEAEHAHHCSTLQHNTPANTPNMLTPQPTAWSLPRPTSCMHVHACVTCCPSPPPLIMAVTR